MNESSSEAAARRQDPFGRAVAARLSQGTADLPHDISERLRTARMQALARRKVASVQPVTSVALSGGRPGLGAHEQSPSLWQRLGVVVPLLVLVVGLVTIQMVQDDRRAREVAEVDAALLTDDLPPAAYADPGFLQFLKSRH